MILQIIYFWLILACLLFLVEFLVINAFVAMAFGFSAIIMSIINSFILNNLTQENNVINVLIWLSIGTIFSFCLIKLNKKTIDKNDLKKLIGLSANVIELNRINKTGKARFSYPINNQEEFNFIYKTQNLEIGSNILIKNLVSSNPPIFEVE